MRRLQEGQQQLQQELGDLMEGLGEMGIQPGEGFGDAGDHMGNAGQALGEGGREQAVGEQGEALQALRRGAQDMMQQMMQAMGEDGEGQPGGRRQSSTATRLAARAPRPDRISATASMCRTRSMCNGRAGFSKPYATGSAMRCRRRWKGNIWSGCSTCASSHRNQASARSMLRRRSASVNGLGMTSTMMLARSAAISRCSA